MVAVFSLIVSILMFVAFVIFEILKYKRDKKINKSSTNIIILARNPTPENLIKIREEAESIASKTSSSIALPSLPIANPQNEARVKKLRESQPKLDAHIKERQDKEQQI